ncbi:MAG: hypothetical protein ACD_49C00056G0017 [uncultured bacterium (gcode 4)]|uniref:Uncharacterized protein n=1 Tax=uncultured bacterium (gcode 4) TaxID=1234023 RepID=K2AWU8_9BACT|nr:MAG: hypothetical protein ACD_49C00056G0017 [uncultured bacterium (gcode 4)]
MNKKWFSTIIAMLLTAFLIILSAWILFLVLQESKITRTVLNTVSTYAGAEWSLEYALLKIKNHEDWFSDSVNNDDFDSNFLANNTVAAKNQIIWYDIYNSSSTYTWYIKSSWFEIIPLFYDKWSLIQTNSKNPNPNTSDISKTLNFKFNSDTWITWNIIWNNASWDTFWIVGSGSSFGTGYTVSSSIWLFKKTYENTSTDAIDFKLENIDIWTFLATYSNNYLIIYNHNLSDVSYTMESSNWFSLPNLEIISYSNIWDFKQNIKFTENKSKYFDILKYSLFNK